MNFRFSTRSISSSNGRFALSAVIIAGLACAYESVDSKPASAPSKKTTITSDRMIVRNKDSQAEFEGQVVLTRGPLVVRSDNMVVFFETARSPEGDGSTGAEPAGQEAERSGFSVKRIEATGRVQIEREEGRATCQKAVYYQEEQKIVLTGQPVAWQKGNRVMGQKITLFLAEDRTIVEGGSRLLLDEVVATR